MFPGKFITVVVVSHDPVYIGILLMVSLYVNADLLNHAVQRCLAFQERGGNVAALLKW